MLVGWKFWIFAHKPFLFQTGGESEYNVHISSSGSWHSELASSHSGECSIFLFIFFNILSTAISSGSSTTSGSPPQVIREKQQQPPVFCWCDNETCDLVNWTNVDDYFHSHPLVRILLDKTGQSFRRFRTIRWFSWTLDKMGIYANHSSENTRHCSQLFYWKMPSLFLIKNYDDVPNSSPPFPSPLQSRDRQ